MRGRQVASLACVVGALAFAGSAGAEQDAAPLAGQRIRAHLTGMKAPLVGEVVAVGEQHLTLETAAAERVEIRWADVSWIERSRGKRGNTVRGLVGGATALGVLVALVATFSTLDESGVGEPLRIGTFLAGGAFIGSQIRTEKWEPEPSPWTGGVARRCRGFGVRLAVS